MTSLVYPATLPPPVSAPFKPARRLRTSDLPGKRADAARERDFRGTQEVAFVFDAAEAAAFDAWWRVDLKSGGALFAAEWPTPAGWSAPAVRKFVGAPQWAFVPGGAWRVSVPTEVLGAHRLKKATDIDTYDAFHSAVHVTSPQMLGP